MKIEVYGKLKSEVIYVPLEVAESEKEYNEIIEEYKNVFGDEIEFFTHKLTVDEYCERKLKALTNLMLLISKN
jgi:hypothetical protein